MQATIQRKGLMDIVLCVINLWVFCIWKLVKVMVGLYSY